MPASVVEKATRFMNSKPQPPVNTKQLTENLKAAVNAIIDSAVEPGTVRIAFADAHVPLTDAGLTHLMHQRYARKGAPQSDNRL